MKQIISILLLVSMSLTLNAQWTNGTDISNTNSGNVGIGNAAPTEKLHVGGYDKVNIRIGQWATLGIIGSHLGTVLGNNVKASSTNNNMEILTSTGDGAKAIKMQYNEGIAFHTFQGPVTAGSVFSSERMRIDNSGNVGIGINAPAAKLHIQQANGGWADGIRLNYSGKNWDLVSDSGGDRLIVTKDQNIDYGFSIYNGKFGIGTLSPQHRLHVKGRFYLEGTEAYPSGWMQNYFHWRGHSLIMGSMVGDYAHNTIELKAGGASNGPLLTNFQMFQTPSPNNYELKIHLTSSGASFFNGGNVGIGTTTPDQKLTVDGTVKCEEVKVEIFTGTGPDYVFEKDYNLLPLSELETYVNKNKHLPEVPSAKEMEAEGLNLKEMNLLLLKKVEELTLHLIEQQKKIESLTLKVNQMNH